MMAGAVAVSFPSCSEDTIWPEYPESSFTPGGTFPGGGSSSSGTGGSGTSATAGVDNTDVYTDSDDEIPEPLLTGQSPSRSLPAEHPFRETVTGSFPSAEMTSS